MSARCRQRVRTRVGRARHWTPPQAVSVSFAPGVHDYKIMTILYFLTLRGILRGNTQGSVSQLYKLAVGLAPRFLDDLRAGKITKTKHAFAMAEVRTNGKPDAVQQEAKFAEIIEELGYPVSWCLMSTTGSRRRSCTRTLSTRSSKTTTRAAFLTTNRGPHRRRRLGWSRQRWQARSRQIGAAPNVHVRGGDFVSAAAVCGGQGAVDRAC